MAGLTVPRTGPTSLKRRNASAPLAYSPTLASKLLGINYNTILYWVRTKLVRASVRCNDRSTTKRCDEYACKEENTLKQIFRQSINASTNCWQITTQFGRRFVSVARVTLRLLILCL